MFKRNDWIFGLISLALGIFVLVYCSGIDEITSMDPSGPAAMPRIVAWLMILIGVVHLAGAYSVIKKNPNPEPNKKKKGSMTPVILICAACAVYYFLLEQLGYLVMTPLLIIAIMLSVGDRKFTRILGTSVGTSAFLFCVFQYILGVNMPLGILSGFLR